MFVFSSPFRLLGYDQRVLVYGRVALRMAFASAVSLALPGLAQAQTGTSRIVLAAATDAGERPLTSLTEDDFVVREAGTLREVLAVRLADYPIVLLIDDTAGSAGALESLRTAATRFVARIGRDRPVAIGALGHPGTMITNFEANRTQVLAAIGGMKSEGSFGAGVLQGIAAGADMIRATGAPFSAVVLISAADPDAPAEAAVDRLAPIIDSRAAVHVVARAPAAGSGAVGTLIDTLRTVSGQTRGQFTAVFSAVSYPSALDRLADRLAAEMMIEFIEPPGVAPSDDVKVGVRVPGARVRGLGISR